MLFRSNKNPGFGRDFCLCITTFNFGNATTRQREMHYYLIVGARDRFTHLLRLHQLRQLLLQIMNAGAATQERRVAQEFLVQRDVGLDAFNHGFR